MIVLDTHILVWMVIDPGRIPDVIVKAIAEAAILGVAAISLWEIALLHERKRISLPGELLPWLSELLNQPKIRLIPLTPEIAARSVGLEMHGDPADRLITATAIENECRLATVDARLLNLGTVKTVV